MAGAGRYLEPYGEAARTWLRAEAKVVDTTHLMPGRSAQQIREAVKAWPTRGGRNLLDRELTWHWPKSGVP